MNLPISETLRQRYSVVYDGGKLEHVFNQPQALKNCMEMVRVGGYFLQTNTANKFMGHGFWQFSPE
jgi:2-polyprenyl-3-methyl-5-hydroxy-6-metoxy-1,4-benzoquinol methylase